LSWIGVGSGVAPGLAASAAGPDCVMAASVVRRECLHVIPEGTLVACSEDIGR